jgi:hypothetical protein
VIVSAPHSYPIKRVEGCWVRVYGGLLIRPFPTAHNDPEADNERTYYRFLAKRDMANDKPAIHFTDWHSNLYYYYRGHTLRLPGDTDWQEGVFKVDVWVGAGPAA